MGRDLFLGTWAGTPDKERAAVPPERFTTHAVVIGMTGSGKTGLVVDILEEAALSGIPTVVIDPKGDLTNRLLVFPECRSEDFEPFCAPGAGPETAKRWNDSLAAWGVSVAERTALKGVPVRVLTPGASASPVNVLERFDPPRASGEADPEITGAASLGAVASLFTLAGLPDDPGTSPEGLLLTQLLLMAWAGGRGLTLEELVQQVLTPPITRLGVMDLDAVIPAKDRTALAMKLNALLASPSFALWRKGAALDADSMLGKGAGATQSIFTLAHLSDQERLFFLGLLLGELSAWTRRQTGSEHLRALIVFDEVFGYFPPYPLNPPTKGPLLTLLKQARAFGVGVVLATQNPVDLDYKGLTNAGLWFLGRLQTEQDRERVADALGPLVGGGDAAAMLSNIPPRSFLVHDVKAPAPRLMETRQCISFLAGPLVGQQLKALLGSRGGSDPSGGPSALTSQNPLASFLAGKCPIVPAGWQAVFTPGEVLWPALEIEADIAFKVSPRSTPILQRRRAAWSLSGPSLESALATEPLDTSDLTTVNGPDATAQCQPLPPYFDRTDPARGAKLAAASLALRARLDLLKDPLTGEVQRPGETREAFDARAATCRKALAQAESDKKLGSLQRQLQKASDRVANLELELRQDEADASARTTETVVSAGLGLLGGLFGSRRSVGGAISRTVSKTRMASRAKGEVDQTASDLESARRDRDQLQGQLKSAREEIAARFGDTPHETLTLTPGKSGVQVLLCRLVWRPTIA